MISINGINARRLILCSVICISCLWLISKTLALPGESESFGVIMDSKSVGLMGGYHSKTIDDKDCVKAIKNNEEELIKKVKNIEKYNGESPGEIELLTCETQVVAGMNYRVTFKVLFNEGSQSKVYKATIFKSLPCYGGEYELNDVE